MRRVWRRIGWTIAAALGVLLLLALLTGLSANTRRGRAWIEAAVPKFTGGKVTLSQLGGRFPDTLRIGHLGVSDNAGPWLAIDGLSLDWSPFKLLARTAAINRLEAERIAVARLPQASPEPEPEPKTKPSLPVKIVLHSLHVGRLELAEPVLGVAAALSLQGQAQFAALDQGEAGLSLRRLDGEGDYEVKAQLGPDGIRARLSVQEPALGLVAGLARLTELGAVAFDARVDGPYSALNSQFNLAAGPLRSSAQGVVNLDQQSADLVVSATAPAMRLRPDLAWQSVDLSAEVRGPFTKPHAQAKLHIAGLDAAGARIPDISAQVQGDTGALSLTATLAGIRLPGPHPELLQAAPLAIQADLRLDAPELPVKFALRHPLFGAEGQASLGGEPRGEISLKLPDLKPLAALGGQDVRGSAQVNLRAAQRSGTQQAEVDAKLLVTGGAAPWPGLVGDARLGAAASLRGTDVNLERLEFAGKALSFSANGAITGKGTDFNWKLGLADLGALAARLSGRAALQGRLSGPLNDLAVSAEFNGELAAQGWPRGPIAARLNAQGLPERPAGQLTAQGALLGAPLQLAVNGLRGADGGLRITIERADWKSAHAEGALDLPRGAALPLGKVELRMARLDDLAALFGQPVRGAVSASLESGEREARLRMEARKAGLAGSATTERAELAVTVANPLQRPLIDGRLNVEGLAAGAIRGAVKLDASGPLNALDLDLATDLRDLAGADARLTSAAQLDMPGKSLALDSLQATWKKESLRLLEPARIAFGAGLAVDRLRLGLREAVLEVAGRAAPRLALDVALSQVPADLASLAVPSLGLDGTLQAEAHLTGTSARPSGVVRLGAEGVRLRSGPGRAWPPASFNASAELAGTSAQIDAQLKAGPLAGLALSGEAPLVADGAIDLRANGTLDLKLLDPLLMAEGRRTRGQIALNGGVTGTLEAPKAQGELRWSHGEVQDYAQGLRLSDIAALLQAEGDSVRIARFQAKAGPGTLTLNGSVGVLAPGMPIDLKLTARNARPLDSDRLTVNLDADLGVQGQAAGPLRAAGALRIQRAEIRIPERLPTSIAVLDVRKPGAPPPPPPKPGPDIGLDVNIIAPDEIFVRGRGLFAELGGTIHLRGTAADPRPEGRFELRRGEFSLAGQTLNFSKGQVGFDGGSLTDPSLDFAAVTASGGVSATLGVTGTARKPKITLSSVPESPPDEVLAHLLFGRATTSLSPWEMVQIASAVASLTGITSGVGNPLETVRKGLGLDRLAIGGGSGGSPALEAGRYVAPGVFLGAKQGFTGGGTQATVQIDVAKGLKLEGSVGTGGSASSATGASAQAGTNSVGVIYQIEY